MKSGSAQESVDYLQLVTQLEPAGAQSIAHWIETSLDPRVSIETVFLYKKTDSELFSDSRCLLGSRPASLRDVAKLIQRYWIKTQTITAPVIAHTHYAITVAVLASTIRIKRRSVIAVHHWPETRYPLATQIALRWARFARLLAEEVYVSESVARFPSSTVILNPVPPKPIGVYVESPLPDIDILTVARHAPEKSLSTLIESMSLLSAHRRLTLVGGGEITDDLKAQAISLGLESRIDFLGRLPNRVARQYMAKAKVFVLPSLWEAMPVVVLEAISADTDIIVSNIKEHQYFISRDAALSFTVGDPLDLAEAIKAIASEPSLQDRVATGRSKVRSELNESTVAELWFSLLERNSNG